MPSSDHCPYCNQSTDLFPAHRAGDNVFVICPHCGKRAISDRSGEWFIWRATGTVVLAPKWLRDLYARMAGK